MGITITESNCNIYDNTKWDLSSGNLYDIEFEARIYRGSEICSEVEKNITDIIRLRDDEIIQALLDYVNKRDEINILDKVKNYAEIIVVNKLPYKLDATPNILYHLKKDENIYMINGGKTEWIEITGNNDYDPKEGMSKLDQLKFDISADVLYKYGYSVNTIEVLNNTPDTDYANNHTLYVVLTSGILQFAAVFVDRESTTGYFHRLPDIDKLPEYVKLYKEEKLKDYIESCKGKIFKEVYDDFKIECIAIQVVDKYDYTKSLPGVVYIDKESERGYAYDFEYCNDYTVLYKDIVNEYLELIETKNKNENNTEANLIFKEDIDKVDQELDFLKSTLCSQFYQEFHLTSDIPRLNNIIILYYDPRTDLKYHTKHFEKDTLYIIESSHEVIVISNGEFHSCSHFVEEYSEDIDRYLELIEYKKRVDIITKNKYTKKEDNDMNTYKEKIFKYLEDKLKWHYNIAKFHDIEIVYQLPDLKDTNAYTVYILKDCYTAVYCNLNRFSEDKSLTSVMIDRSLVKDYVDSVFDNSKVEITIVDAKIDPSGYELLHNLEAYATDSTITIPYDSKDKEIEELKERLSKLEDKVSEETTEFTVVNNIITW